MSTEQHFKPFRDQIIGQNLEFSTPYGNRKMLYADWIASGRLYMPIEKVMTEIIGPFVGNTHTETSEVGKLMTQAYHFSHRKIKEHVNAGSDDVIITTGFGMTGAVVKFQRILGLKPGRDQFTSHFPDEKDKPVVFVTHMEHHSNQTTWYETIADVVVVEPGKDLLIDLNHLESALKQYGNRKLKIGAFTACSNVTGIRTPYHAMAKIMHGHGGLAFIDFAASAPYDDMNMHPADPMEKLDAIFFSPHKFLGGPGSSGVLIFDSGLYKMKVPDQPGGGTVDWTNPWGEHKYIDDIEVREDGGTPGFLQAIRTALALELKTKMGVSRIHEQENELVSLALKEFRKVPDLFILADREEDRLGVISFYIRGIHYNLIVSLLSDRFGIQVRGGCACAGTYGHFLLDVSYEQSKRITEKINLGDLSDKPGWVRVSIHPTMTVEEVRTMAEALYQIRKNHGTWEKDYIYNKHTNEFSHKSVTGEQAAIRSWFNL